MLEIREDLKIRRIDHITTKLYPFTGLEMQMIIFFELFSIGIRCENVDSQLKLRRI